MMVKFINNNSEGLTNQEMNNRQNDLYTIYENSDYKNVTSMVYITEDSDRRQLENLVNKPVSVLENLNELQSASKLEYANENNCTIETLSAHNRNSSDRPLLPRPRLGHRHNDVSHKKESPLDF